MIMSKQKKIEGCEDEYNEVIERLANEYVNARNSRMIHLRIEVDKRDLLLIKMKELGIKEYQFNGKIVTVTALEKLKVVSLKDDEE